MAGIVQYKTKAGRAFMIKLSPGEHPSRPEIRIGKATKREAENARLHIEHTIRARKTGSALPGSTADWLEGLPRSLRRRLEKLGLVAPVAVSKRFTVAKWVGKPTSSSGRTPSRSQR